MTGHSLSVWMKSYARSFGKPQRDEARQRLLEFGLGQIERACSTDSEPVSMESADIPLTPDEGRREAA